MPSPQFTEKRLLIIVIFCPERTILAFIARLRNPPDKEEIITKKRCDVLAIRFFLTILQYEMKITGFFGRWCGMSPKRDFILEMLTSIAPNALVDNTMTSI